MYVVYVCVFYQFKCIIGVPCLLSLVCVCVCVHVSCTRVNIRVLKDNDFSGITLLIKQLIALYLSLTMIFFLTRIGR